jgi:hypothetical protein
VGSAVITLRNKFQGTPVLVRIDPRIDRAILDGHECGIIRPQNVYNVLAIDLRVGWPITDHWPCNLDGVQAQICEGPDLCSEEFRFDGSDVTADVNWPASPWDTYPLATAHFTRDGQPQLVTITSLSQGVGTCSGGFDATDWTPAATLTELALPVGTTAGQTETVCFATAEFGELTVSFQATGANIDYDVVIPSAATPTPTTAPTPARLPAAGGGSPPGGFPLLPVTAVLFLTAMAAWFGALGWKRQARR